MLLLERAQCMKYSTEGRFLLPWLCSAALVVVLRFLSAVDLGYDLTLQIQAAQHLLAGKGLSYYWPVGPDLAEPARLLTLTHFPCGYSVFAAALIAMGASVEVVVKVLGAAGTMVRGGGGGDDGFPLLPRGLFPGSVLSRAGLFLHNADPLRFSLPFGCDF